MWVFLGISAPIPGGCNLEFEMPVSPWLRVSYNQSMVNVDHELAALPPNQGDVFPCESESLLYEVYHYYLAQRDFTEDSFFNAIRLLRTVNGAKEFGTEVTDERQVLIFSNVFMFFCYPLSDSFIWFHANYAFTVQFISGLGTSFCRHRDAHGGS